MLSQHVLENYKLVQDNFDLVLWFLVASTAVYLASVYIICRLASLEVMRDEELAKKPGYQWTEEELEETERTI
jgi:hypothetical protein